MDPQEAFEKFMEKAAVHPISPVGFLGLAFFVGYAYGATGARENIDRLVEAFNATQAKD